MKEAIGDTLFNFVILLLVVVWDVGWIVLFLTIVVQKVAPKMDDKIEDFLHVVNKPIRVIKKYSLIVIIILFFIRIIASWLGWAPPFRTERE